MGHFSKTPLSVFLAGMIATLDVLALGADRAAGPGLEVVPQNIRTHAWL